MLRNAVRSQISGRKNKNNHSWTRGYRCVTRSFQETVLTSSQAPTLIKLSCLSKPENDSGFHGDTVVWTHTGRQMTRSPLLVPYARPIPGSGSQRAELMLTWRRWSGAMG